MVKKGINAGEVSRATLKHVRMSPRKARLVVDLIRGKQVGVALQILRFCPKKGAKFAYKLLESAVANAKERENVDVDSLWVTGTWVDAGRTLRRGIPAAHGRMSPIQKRSSHMTLVVGQK